MADRSAAQLSAQAAPAAHKEELSASTALLAAVQTEEKLGTHVFYTQRFIDQQNQWASYRGSVFGGLMDFKMKGCDLTINVTLQDIFTGTVGKQETGRQIDTYSYSLSLTLTREIADRLSLEEAPPAPLASNTHSICIERRSCSFEWLVVRSAKPVLWEKRVLNGFLDVNDATDRFQIPVSSAERGSALMAAIKALAADRCP